MTEPLDLEVRVALVAVVDGNPEHRSQVTKALEPLYQVCEYPNGAQALRGLRAEPPDVLMVDDVTQPRDGFEFIRAVRREAALARTPIIFTSANGVALAEAGRQCGADATVAKPYRRSVLLKTITALRSRDVERGWANLPSTQRAALNGTVGVFNSLADSIADGGPLPFSQVSDACRSLVEAVGKNEFRGILAAVQHHDNYTYVHSLRVATLLTLFGQAAGLTGSDQLVLASGGLLHDAGKLTVPHRVLNKPGRLDEGEVAVMRSHVPATVRLLRASASIPEPIITIAEQHHEKLNGEGYPNGLVGALARMAAIVDVFGALTDRRPYKLPMAAHEALAVMGERMKGHLDQHFLSLFKALLLDAVV